MVEGIDLMQEIMPKLMHIQDQRSFVHTIQPKNRNLMKKNLVVAQGTTTKRTGITVEQHFFWMKTYENYLALL